jgi:hypothetical protein
MRLRHHHLLCAQLFRGEGYDALFVENMTSVVSALGSSEDLAVRLSMGCDDICSCCPHMVGGECEDRDAVTDKDQRAAEFLRLPEEGIFPAGPLWREVAERMRGLDSLARICGRCHWRELCDEALTGGRARLGGEK